MNSDLLKVFVEVANEKSISKAAINLGFAQSNVTSRVKQLENSIGTQLFHRVPKGVILSKEGEKLYAYAIRIVKELELALYEMQNLNQQTHLIIGSTESNASTRLIPFLLQLNKDFPNMSLELVTNTTKDTIKNLLDYKVDIAFISGKPKNEELLILNKIDEDIVLVEPKDKICSNTFLSFKNGCSYNEFGQNYLKNILNEDFKHLEFGNYETILGCIKAGMGRSILPLSIIEKLNYEKDLKITKIAKSVVNIPTFLVCRRDYTPRIKDYLENFKF
ncbi:LysR family transcriptional regulator [Aliarcobacter trophiarum LMG 25534]|uniref:LysR family transcriptional regulator n=1 Tax=Aliarcobacter trophiarum LMG 25534 TaxID=1032241 RepID=A0AAD0QLH0_9BACT|nr:LysR family transcriptional regulator [Aliarcobacter trophiarum]AXK48935.1 transcriptional regulator, LysR family [Aliarcobacter trophiarum LMG 25534]RXI24884.1 LysR family transcriptional regulator [Aliarcobacter trophiarum]RXJ92666.1 LysR family transcriptional regulator [Aliarcobacter trophiarum LMG 25534]